MRGKDDVITTAVVDSMYLPHYIKTPHEEFYRKFLEVNNNFQLKNFISENILQKLKKILNEERRLQRDRKIPTAKQQSAQITWIYVFTKVSRDIHDWCDHVIKNSSLVDDLDNT